MQATIPLILPHWIKVSSHHGLEDAAFFSGAALSHLHTVLAQDGLPCALLRDRLALQAAEVSMGFAGRPERSEALRDAVHLMRPGDLPGPAGEVYLSWQRAVARPRSIKILHSALPTLDAGHIADVLDLGRGSAVARAGAVLEAMGDKGVHMQNASLVLADAALAQAMGWKYVVPLLACGLKRGDLRKRDEALILACHRAVVTAVEQTVRRSADLIRRAEHMTIVASKLRARGAAEAVKIFLSRDAVAPTALHMLRSDYAARRLCARLVDLGAVRELTGRDTFRLYGL